MEKSQQVFESYFFRLLFKLKIYEASGYSFQDLVSQIFEYAIPGFQKIAPWGSQGDGGNDGWVPTCGHYYQVYGPLSTTDWNPVSAANKAKTDFHKLRSAWSNIRHFSFVINDRYEGIPAPIPLTLEELKVEHGLESATPLGANELTASFISLADDQKRMIAGNAPSQQPDFIDARAVGELLTYLADKPSRTIGLLQGLPPDFDQKIVFNGLTEHTASALKFANYQVAYVDDFLNTRGAGLQQAIAEEISQMYIESKAAIPNSDLDAADLRFFWLSQRLLPESVRQHPHTRKAYEWASYTILSKYFETCDLYEHPDSAHTA